MSNGFARRTNATMIIEAATAADLPAIRQLLEHGDLPASDLTERSLEYFLVLREGESISAVVGLELYGDVALLRSLVVADRARNNGYGAKLTAAVEALAQSFRVGEIYLLTTSAEGFFQANGYRRIDRADAPQRIQDTTQFRSLCPATAVLMVKSEFRDSE